MSDKNGADPTADKQRGVPFKPGESGNPAGRPKGSRNKLGEAFLEKLYEDFNENGVDAIQACRVASPETYVRVIASLLPKEVKAEFTQRFVARLPEPVKTTEEWMQKHSPQPSRPMQ